jgi:hypothetical protein
MNLSCVEVMPMIGLTIAMLLAPLAQQAEMDIPARCRAVALRLERTGKVAAHKLDAQYAGLPKPVQDAVFARHVREVRAAQALVKVIRVRYPGPAVRDPQVDALPWADAVAEGRACRDGTR